MYSLVDKSVTRMIQETNLEFFSTTLVQNAKQHNGFLVILDITIMKLIPSIE